MALTDEEIYEISRGDLAPSDEQGYFDLTALIQFVYDRCCEDCAAKIEAEKVVDFEVRGGTALPGAGRLMMDLYNQSADDSIAACRSLKHASLGRAEDAETFQGEAKAVFDIRSLKHGGSE